MIKQESIFSNERIASVSDEKSAPAGDVQPLPEIRHALPEDVPVLAELDKICFDDPWSEESFYEEINQNERALYLVLEAEGRIAGYAGIWKIFDEGHITNIAVHPDFRRRGFGRMIVGALLKTVEADGIVAETLEVRRSNAAAIGLYSSFGFEVEGVRKGYYASNGEDALIMWRKAWPTPTCGSK